MDEKLLPCRTCGKIPHIWKTGRFMQDMAYDERHLVYDNDPQCLPLCITEVVIVRCEECRTQMFKTIEQPGAIHNVVHWWNKTYGDPEKM